jgi:hypothetical protein
LTEFGGGSVIGGMGREIKVDSMQMRLKAPAFGEVETVRNCGSHFRLPPGLPEFAGAVLLGHESGRYIVHAFGRDWNIALQCVKHERRCVSMVFGWPNEIAGFEKWRRG